MNDGVTRGQLELDMEGPVTINALELSEPPGLEHVQEYRVLGQVDSDWKLLSQGTTIGGRKIDRFPAATVWKVRVMITKASEYPALRKVGLYAAPDAPGAAARLPATGPAAAR